jgi:benzoate membrane transport protein
MERLRPWLAGVVSALVGFSSSFTVVLAGLRAVGGSEQQAASGLLTASVLMGVAGIVLSARHRIPISVVWSTPGAALLAASGVLHGGFATAVAGFGICGLLIIASGLLRPLRLAVEAIPAPLANGLLAGVLLKLCVVPATTLVHAPGDAAPVIATWLILGRVARRWAVPAAMAVAVIEIALHAGGRLAASGHSLLPTLSLTAPRLSLQALTLGVSLFVVTMASQNVPGLTVLKGYGYRPPVAEALAGTGAATVAGAVLGGQVINLAAITAALCAGPDAGEDVRRRWLASVSAGGCYVLLGLAAGLLSALAAVAPLGLVGTVAGLALLPTLGAALAAATTESKTTPGTREASVIAFLVTASGVVVGGVGSPFWGLIAGGGALALMTTERQLRVRSTPAAVDGT